MPAADPVPAPQPSWRVRAGLLLALPLLAAALYWEGQQYDPGLLEFKRAGSAAGLALPATLHTLPRLGEVRRYSKDNLYEYINGHAEFFIGAGFSGLTVVEYAPPGSPQPHLVADLFDMGKPLHAFGVLMDESGEGATPLQVGAMGFQSGRGVQFIQGRFYVKLTAFDPALPLPEIAAALAAALPKGEGMALAFPDLGTVTATRFIKENYRGMPFLGNVLERTFTRGGQPLTLFLLTAPGAELDKVERELTTFQEQEGMTHRREEVAGLVLTVVEDPYEGTWFYYREPERMVGVFSAPEPELVQALRPTEGKHGRQTQP